MGAGATAPSPPPPPPPAGGYGHRKRIVPVIEGDSDDDSSDNDDKSPCLRCFEHAADICRLSCSPRCDADHQANSRKACFLDPALWAYHPRVRCKTYKAADKISGVASTLATTSCSVSAVITDLRKGYHTVEARNTVLAAVERISQALVDLNTAIHEIPSESSPEVSPQILKNG